MKCPLCRSPVPRGDATCPNCGKNVAAWEYEIDTRPEASRKLATIACALATPAWICGLSYLLMVPSRQGGWLHGLAAVAVLLATLAALGAALWAIDGLGRLQVAGCVAAWIALLGVVTPSFGIFGFLLLIPFAGLAALAVLLGLAALVQHWRDGWPARSMALLACAGLPLLLGSLSLMGGAHAVRQARLDAQPKVAMNIPPEQERFFVHLEGGRHIALPRKTYCVVAPEGGPVPTPEQAAGMVAPIAAEDLKPGTFLLRNGMDGSYAVCERLDRVEPSTTGRPDGMVLVPESWPHQLIGVAYPGDSFLGPLADREEARPIPVEDVRAGMYIQVCQGRTPRVGLMLIELVSARFEKVTSIRLGP
jgi:hypothetical protein